MLFDTPCELQVAKNGFSWKIICARQLEQSRETDNKQPSASSFAVAERADRRRGTASLVESDRRGAWAESSREHVARIRVSPAVTTSRFSSRQIGSLAIRICKELLSEERVSHRCRSLRCRDAKVDNEIQTNIASWKMILRIKILTKIRTNLN